LVKEGVNCRKHGADDEKLEHKERSLVEKEDNNAYFCAETMFSTLATRHLHEVSKYFRCAKHGTVHPTTTLLHQYHHRLWRVCESFGVWNIGQLVPVCFLNIDL